MLFHFDGLPEPLALPDDYLTLKQFESVNRFARKSDTDAEDPRFMRECLGVLLEDTQFLSRTDALPMTQRNVAEWNRLATHLGMLISGGKPDPLAKPGARKRKRAS